jgi:hypothetical protein
MHHGILIAAQEQQLEAVGFSTHAHSTVVCSASSSRHTCHVAGCCLSSKYYHVVLRTFNGGTISAVPQALEHHIFCLAARKMTLLLSSPRSSEADSILPSHCYMPQALEHHIKEEEDEMLAEFASKVQREDLAHLSDKFQKSKLHVPTR